VSEAEERSWELVRRAFEERPASPPPGRRHRLAAAVAVAVLVAVVVAVGSPPGHAVFKRVREAVGVQRADPALFALPAPGRLLVVSPGGGGVWLVHDDGGKRRVGDYTDAQWSPFGRYVVVTRPDGLSALDLDEGIRWSLARRQVEWPRWEGTHADTRIAYVAASGLRVVGGDGRGDRLLDARATTLAPAWDPARLHTLAYVHGGSAVLRNVDSQRVLWRAPLARREPLQLAWSDDGRYLAARTLHRVLIFDAQGRLRRSISSLSETFLALEFRPGTHELALSARQGSESLHSSVRLVDVDHPGTARLLFSGPGAFCDATWSPNGRWLLLDWRTANQWLFVSPGTRPRVHAVANIREEFPRADDRPPTLVFQGRWCCSRS
jgi:hypothetical protein